MASEWSRFCAADDLEVERDALIVRFMDGRSQRVTVVDAGESYELASVVAKRAVVDAIADVPLRAWLRNRSAQLVGFRVDRSGKLVGESWVPKQGLTAEEFRLHIRTLARESDRFEFVLTGRDVE